MDHLPNKNSFSIVRKTVLTCCYLITIAFSIKSLKEPDVWWQIRTGEWILQHHQVPVQDVFSYTQAGNEWINIKWGFEVIAALISNTIGPESICFLQAIVSCLIFFFLLKSTKLLLSSTTTISENKNLFYCSVFLAFIPSIMAMEYRMNSRPEMFSHLFSVVFIFLLISYRIKPSSKLFLLIPLQLIWANMHEAYGAGIIIQVIFLLGAVLDQWFLKNFNSENRKQLLLKPLVVLILSVLAMAVNPNGFRLITRPLSIFGQVLQNKFTTELLPASSPSYWQKEAYISLILLIIVFCGFAFLKREKKKSFFASVFKNYGFGNLILIAAFLYLALTAFRNIVFLILVLFPFIVSALYSILSRISSKKTAFFHSSKKSVFMIGGISLVFYTLIVSNVYYSITNSRDRFGAELNSMSHPEGAAKYILEHDLKKKRCFSDYLTSSYLLWRLQPEFKTFIDLRDLDVFSRDFFTKYLSSVSSPYVFNSLDSIYHFDYAVVFRRESPILHKFLYNDSIFALTYVDAVAAVYEKTDSFSRSDIFSKSTPIKTGTFAKTFTRILNPFFSPFNYREVNYDLAAASYYSSVGAYNLAEERARICMDNKKSRHEGTEMLGRIFYMRALLQKDSVQRTTLFDLALEKFQSAQKIKPDFALAYSGAGAVYLKERRYKAAITSFEKSLRLDNSEANALAGCAESYLGLAFSSGTNINENLEQALDYYLKCNRLKPGNAPVYLNIGLIAVRLKKKDLAAKYLQDALDTKLLNTEDQLKAADALRSL